ncbi:hypothetical protein [Bacillus sp. UNC438CL73TsuS30]|uniref:hypothetical protein n=1 Tax=Bacillus sp. UNC438CL73TsuS30 TaxID=1340434 RepID=UPI0004793EF4|nr:hypothetical protein [Bacillus sp. UNC438CL73TsuS30]
MNTNELRAWAEKHDVEKKTINCFWEAINSYEQYYCYLELLLHAQMLVQKRKTQTPSKPMMVLTNDGSQSTMEILVNKEIHLSFM